MKTGARGGGGDGPIVCGSDCRLLRGATEDRERTDVAGQRYTVAGEGGISAVSALWFLIIAALGAFVFLLISAGSWEEAMSRLRQFFSREFADVWGGRRKE